MTGFALDERSSGIIDPRDIEAFDVLGPTVEYLTAPGKSDDDVCVMRGTIPPGVVVPLHAHADPETFVQLSGEIEGFSQSRAGSQWILVRPGDVFHVPGGARHAFRNRFDKPSVAVIISTSKIGRFFREIGARKVPGARPSGPPSEATLRHFLELSEQYGYWNATPEENAQIGLALPFAA